MGHSDSNTSGNSSFFQIALSHFFIGLIKADGEVSSAEEKKLEQLIENNRSFLPQQYRAFILADIDEMLDDEEVANWTPEHHNKLAFESLDAYVNEAKGVDDIVEPLNTLMSMLNELMEVGGINDEELFFIKNIKKDLKSKYKFIAKDEEI